MDPLVRVSLGARRLLRRGHGLATLGGLSVYVVAGGATAPIGPFLCAGFAAWLYLLSTRLRSKLSATADAPWDLDLELGIALAVGLNAALLRFDGGLDGRFSPLVYVLVALVAAMARPLAALLVVAGILVHEAALRTLLLHETDLTPLWIHAAFIGAFALLSLSFLRGEVARIRRTATARIEEQIDRLKQDARSYRLLGAGEASAQDDGRGEDRLTRSSVEEIHLSVHYALDLLRRSLGLHTAVLLWLNHAGTHLRISELSTVSDEVSDVPFAAGDGVLGAALAQRAPIALHSLRPSYKIPYYSGPSPVRVLAAIPVLEEQSVRGVLVIDRVTAKAFSEEEEEVAAQAARFCLRAIQNERIFVQLERAKVEQGKLYRAAQALGAALSEKDVLDAAIKAAREIASFDLGMVTVFDEPTRIHEICAAAESDGDNEWVGKRFAHNTGLVSMVVQNRCPLPYRAEHDPGQVVLSKRFAWPQQRSLLVLPLILQDRALGTLILSAKRRNAFGDTVRPTLEVLASHLAVSFANARMVHKLETMATTDGLTGLLNKRAMLDAATQKVAAAARFQRYLSVLIADIDFFKKVNDTYGHDVGDVVIRGLADILKRQKRATDLVARFGGEEFVVVCEQTDDKGALLLGERIREDLKKTVFRSAGTTFSVTCSIGIATFPEAGRTWEELFKSSDEALYVSKRSGRDRTTASHAPRKSMTQPTRYPAPSGAPPATATG
jgi:diguanylate cyclase (GGDEF)-like protein